MKNKLIVITSLFIIISSVTQGAGNPRGPQADGTFTCFSSRLDCSECRTAIESSRTCGNIGGVISEPVNLNCVSGPIQYRSDADGSYSLVECNCTFQCSRPQTLGDLLSGSAVPGE